MKIKNAFEKISSFMTKHKYVSCAMAGGLYSLAFFYGYLFAFAFIGLFLYFLVLLEKSENSLLPKKIFRKTLCFSLGFYIPLYSWFFVLYPFEAFGFSMLEGIFIVIAADIGLGIFHSLINSSSFCLLYLFPKNTRLLPLGAGCCMIVSEFIVSNLGFLSFPWGIAAVGVYRFLPLIKTVSLFGPYLIALIVGSFCCIVAVTCLDFSKANIWHSLETIVFPLALGTILLIVPTNCKSCSKLTVSCVQGNIPSMEKWDSGRLNDIIETYADLTKQAAESGADLIVLPESAIPTKLTRSILNRFTDIAEKYNTYIILSGIVYENENKYNSLLLINPDGTLGDERYDKRHLVPFGEYLPLEKTLTKLFPFISKINLSSSPFKAGSESKLFFIKDKNGDSVCISPLICFDSIFPSLARELPGDFIVVSTNDSWYEDSPGVYQHEAQSVLRGVENGKWVVRCANTGVSCFISPDGIIKSELAPLTQGILTETITVDNRMTIYTSIGDIILVIPLGYIIYSIAYAIYEQVKRKDKSNGNNQTL